MFQRRYLDREIRAGTEERLKHETHEGRNFQGDAYRPSLRGKPGDQMPETETRSIPSTRRERERERESRGARRVTLIFLRALGVLGVPVFPLPLPLPLSARHRDGGT